MRPTREIVKPEFVPLLEAALEQPASAVLNVRESSTDVWDRMLRRAIDEAKKNSPKPGEKVTIQIMDAPQPARFDNIMQAWANTAMMITHKEPHELTEHEKFCIAFAAGCEIETFSPERQSHSDPLMLHWRIKHPCAIVKRNGRFTVYLQP